MTEASPRHSPSCLFTRPSKSSTWWPRDGTRTERLRMGSVLSLLSTSFLPQDPLKLTQPGAGSGSLSYHPCGAPGHFRDGASLFLVMTGKPRCPEARSVEAVPPTPPHQGHFPSCLSRDPLGLRGRVIVGGSWCHGLFYLESPVQTKAGHSLFQPGFHGPLVEVTGRQSLRLQLPLFRLLLPLKAKLKFHPDSEGALVPENANTTSCQGPVSPAVL